MLASMWRVADPFLDHIAVQMNVSVSPVGRAWHTVRWGLSLWATTSQFGRYL